MMKILQSYVCVPLFFLLSFAYTQSLACDAPAWDSATGYSRNDVVSHASHEWRAKRSSTGVAPGTHKPSWAGRGACETTEPPNPPPPTDPTPIQIFGVWHAGNHYADWSVPRDMVEFDAANHWIIDRGDGSGLPSVNLVILSFVHPVRLMDKTDDAVTANGLPIAVEADYSSDGIQRAGHDRRI